MALRVDSTCIAALSNVPNDQDKPDPAISFHDLHSLCATPDPCRLSKHAQSFQLRMLNPACWYDVNSTYSKSDSVVVSRKRHKQHGIATL